MPNNSKGLHHYHLRKRIHQKHEPFPHPQKLKRSYDKFISFVAFVAPLSNIPQLNKVWIEKDVMGVSVISWALFSIISLIWLGYGILHKEKPIIVSNILWFFIQLSIVIGVTLYS
jgi:uncharacterized protein with PQ loop repeat